LRLFVSEMPADDDACATSETQLESTTATHHRRFFIANEKYPASHLRLFVSAMLADGDCLSST